MRLVAGLEPGTSVTLGCMATDVGSGIAGEPGQVLTAVGAAGVELEAVVDPVPACDLVGLCTDLSPFVVLLDDAAPTVTCDATPDQWFPGPVTLPCVAADGGAGLNEADMSFVLTATIAEGGVNAAVPFDARQVCDLLGHCTPTPVPAPARIDRALPQAVCQDPPAGVSAMEVDLLCTTSDEGLGLADPSADSVFHLRTNVGPGNTDLAALTSSRHVCDVAGGCIDVGPFTVAVDRTLPPPAPPPNLLAPARIVAIIAANPGAPGAPTLVPGIPYEVPGAANGAGIVVVTCRGSARCGVPGRGVVGGVHGRG